MKVWSASFVLVILLNFWSGLLEGDTAVATFTISAVVPPQVSVTAQSISTDVDLSFTPNSRSADDLLLGFLHFKYNVPVQSITLSSDTVTGQPEDINGRPYSTQGVEFSVAFAPGCFSVDSAYNVPFNLTSAGADVKSQGATQPSETVDETCKLSAVWSGNLKRLPAAGKYLMAIKVVVIAI